MNRRPRNRPLGPALLSLMLAAGCEIPQRGQDPAIADGPGEVAVASPAPAAVSEAPLPVDRPDAWPEIREWGLSRALEVDLDGDGEAERVVLAANVGLDGRGRPMWDDGQRWAVAIVEPDSSATLLYERFVQLGRIDVGTFDMGGLSQLLITESGPNGGESWRARYLGGGEVGLRIMESAPPTLTYTLSLPE